MQLQEIPERIALALEAIANNSERIAIALESIAKTQRSSEPIQASEVVEYEGLQLNPLTKSIRRLGGEWHRLSPMPLALMATLMRHNGGPISFKQIIEENPATFQSQMQITGAASRIFMSGIKVRKSHDGLFLVLGKRR